MNKLTENVGASAGPTCRSWRERAGLPETYPLHNPSGVELAMLEEIADLRARLALIADDGYAATFQSLGQYRMALLRAASANTAPAAEGAQAEWQSIETAPKDGRTLLLGRTNEMGKWRTMRGQWFTKAEIDQDWEETDGFEAGWYETAVEPDYPNCWAIAPTHWQPLPKAPRIDGDKQGALKEAA